jgi:hypothetical protein
MERAKFLSPDRRFLLKFEGFGRFGEEIRRRAAILSDAGYASPSEESVSGFGRYPFVEGTILTRSAVSRVVLERLAEYCAFRCRAFAVRSCCAPNEVSSSPDFETLQAMVRANVAAEFGPEVDYDPVSLATADPILVDGRMMPHKWVRTHDGCLLKCDGTTHGDDLFLPGPAADICWDLAGVIVEWELAKDAAVYFLERYRAASGDDPRPRLKAFLRAYTVFCFAYCKTAASAMRGSEEEPRLLAAYRHYRHLASALLPRREAQAAD